MSPIERQSETSLDYRHYKNDLNGHVICLHGTEILKSSNSNNNNNEDVKIISSGELKRQVSNSSSNSSSIDDAGNGRSNYIQKLRQTQHQIDDFPKCNRNRQLFGIQLEVTNLLLEAERRKLAVLQRELQVALEDSGSIKKAKEQLKQELILAISRIQLQYNLLEKEYNQHAIGRLRSSNTRGIGKSNRSQPAIGLKQTPKARVSTNLYFSFFEGVVSRKLYGVLRKLWVYRSSRFGRQVCRYLKKAWLQDCNFSSISKVDHRPIGVNQFQ